MRVLGLAAVIVIAVLSLVPNELRPHVGPKLLEHFSAYFGAAALLALAWPQRSAVIVLALPAYSAALEIAQLWVPGRTTSFADFAASSLGACLGVVLVWAARRTFFRSRLSPAAPPGSG